MLTKGLKYLLLMAVLAIMLVPLVEENYTILPDLELDGAFEIEPEPTLSIEDWKSSDFQSDYEAYLNDNLSARDLLVRLRNQYYFSIFDEAKANAIVIGKEGVLLDNGYVEAFYGTDFAGDEYLIERLEKWRRIQRGLDSLGVKAFLALAPGKASFFEDQFPDRLRSEHQPNTNYRFIKDWSQTNDLRILDLKKVYHAWNDTSRYPLFPKGGIHWSEYGVAHVMDTLRGYIQGLTGNALPKFWFTIELSDTARGIDNDIARGMNLLFTPKEEKLAYPIRYFEENDTLAPTNFLVIGDSYYYNLMYSGFANRICSYGGFWYYFRTADPPEAWVDQKVENLNILEELKKQHVLMLMMTEPQLKNFGWDAIDKLEEVLYPATDQ